MRHTYVYVYTICFLLRQDCFKRTFNKCWKKKNFFRIFHHSLHQESQFPKVFPPVLNPAQSLQKSKAQTFSKWNVLRQKIVKLSLWRRKETENICAYSPPHPISLQQLSDFFVENLQDFNGGVQFSWKAPSVWRSFPWKAIQIFRARMRVSMLLFSFKQNIETVTLSIYIARFVGASEEKGQ